MKISTTGLDFIKHWETKDKSGVPDLTVYLDSAGYLTVGYGHKVISSDNLKNGDKITKTQAENFLKNDLNTAETAVNSHPKIAKMSQSQYDAVVSLVYNVGTKPVVDKNNDLYKALNDSATYVTPISEEKIQAIVVGFTYTKAGGVRLQGLVNRRNEELGMFFGTKYRIYIV